MSPAAHHAAFVNHIPLSPPQSWGAEGYHLWVVPSIPEKRKRRRSQEQQQQEVEEKEEEEEQEEEQELNEQMADPPAPCSPPRVGILQFHFIKSALTVNPCTVRDRPGSVPTATARQAFYVVLCSPLGRTRR